MLGPVPHVVEVGAMRDMPSRRVEHIPDVSRPLRRKEFCSRCRLECAIFSLKQLVSLLVYLLTFACVSSLLGASQVSPPGCLHGHSSLNLAFSSVIQAEVSGRAAV